MSMILSIYSVNAFKEFLLSSINNADHTITLQKEFFDLKDDLAIKLEVLDGIWKLKRDYSYIFHKDRKQEEGNSLKDKDIWMISTRNNEKVSIIVKETDSVFHAYQKYDLKGVKQISIGKDEKNDIIWNHLNMVSKEHARIEKDESGYKIVNKGANGIYVNAKKIHTEQHLKFGDYINIMGLHIVYMDEILAIDGDDKEILVSARKLRLYEDNSEETMLLPGHQKNLNSKILYHRAPRNYESLEEDKIEIEGPPEKPKTKQEKLIASIGPSITMALPMLVGCMMMIYATKTEGGSGSLYMYSGVVMSISSAFVGVIWSVMNQRNQRKEEAEQEEYRFQTYSTYLLEKTEEVKAGYEKARNILEKQYPEVSTCLQYNESGNLLWERNATHGDFLKQRLGIGDIPFQTTISIPQKRFTLYKDELSEKPEFIKQNYKTLYQVPITIDLMKNQLIGVIGGNDKKKAIQIAQILSGQIAANNCYTDVKLGYIYAQNSLEEKEGFEFAKWLPHVWSEDKKLRFIASNKEEASDIFYELSKVFRNRKEESEAKRKDGREIPKPWYIIFITDMSLLEGEVFSKYAFEKNPEYGLTVILLGSKYEQLPNQCEFIIQNDENYQGMYSVYDHEDQKKQILFDQIEEEKLNEFSRRLSRFWVYEIEEGGEIPESISYFEMLGVHKLSEIPVKDNWIKHRTYEHISGMIGHKAGGVPCYLDVHEKYHGPHGLVAGTTGSGKSETLQSYILSLAINYSPDDVGFFIIDYKGGGMANLFEGLPHMIGQISNLSGNQVKRAMISIKSENKRRQKIFNKSGVNNINAYTKLYKNDEVKLPVPHLFIIIDEFAELKREEPEFMKELISVAQVGRSLGVHLILATQKPSGTVDDNIWSNSKFRLCLRVQDKQDSNDMLHKPDAAYLTQAGRCYLQVGNDEIYEQFQSGYSGAVYNENVSGNDSVQLLTLNGKVEIKPAQKKNEKNQKEISQLEAVKDYLKSIAKENGYDHQHQLWMPLLPQYIYLNEFEEYCKDSYQNGQWKNFMKGESLEVIVGKIDDPKNQSQIPLKIDFLTSGHIAVCGSVVSGKSTLIQSMLYAVIKKYTPDDVNIYAIDFSSKILGAFAEAPHMGGVMYENDLDKIDKFFHMLKQMLQDRKNILKGGNYKQYIQINGAVLPAVLIVIDNYSGFREKTEEQYEEFIVQLSREGVNHGIYLIVSGTGFGMNDINQRLAENIETVLCLNLQDRYAYGDLLHTNQIDVIPEEGMKGRGLTMYHSNALEFQSVLSVEAENDYQRQELITAECLDMKEHWNGRNAKQIPEIPKKPVWSAFRELEDFNKMKDSREYVPVAYDAANAAVWGVPLKETYCYLIWGTKRSGKTNFMKIWIQSVMERDSHICVIDGPEQSLRAYKNNENLVYCNDEDSVFGFFAQLLPEFKRRNQLKNQLLDEDLEEEEIFEIMSKEIPYFIFISDLSWFVPFIYEAEKDMRGFLENILEKGKLHNIYFISELSLEKRELITGYAIYEFFAGYQTGIHFGGKVSENQVLTFDYLPFMEQSKTEKPGIGQLPDVSEDNTTQKIVVPLARK